MSSENELKKISMIYNSDKIKHGYIDIYYSYFEKIKDKKLKILEIGIADGKSLLTWSDYFKSSIIIGIDVHKINITEKKLDRKNIEIYQGSQSDKDFTNHNWSGHNVLLFGSEGFGLKLHTKKNSDFLLRININEKVESLNLSNSVSIVFHYLYTLKKMSKN